MQINRREWMKQSLLASSTILLAGAPVAVGCASERREAEEDELQGKLLLNWNENPYGPSETAKEAVNDMMQFANRYPDEQSQKVRTELAALHGLKADNYLLTAGSTEVLSLLGQHVGLKKGELLAPYPTFPTALRFGEMAGATIKRVPLDKEERIDLERTLNAITDKTTLVFICNPNNPTGTEVPTDELKEFCRRVPKSVLIAVDEAYIEYSKAGLSGSMVSLVNEVPNLVVCRTFSKAYGLAGLRMGYAVSQEANIQALAQRHLGFLLATGWPPLAAASACLKDQAFIDMCVAKNLEGRKIVYDAFDGWGVKYSPSSTNFIYTRHEHFEKEVVSYLAARDILITKWPSMKDHIRISISKPEHMRTFVNTIKDFRI